MGALDLRNRELAAIHVAKKQLALDDAAYREILLVVAGVSSAKDLDEEGRRKVLDHFRGCGFDPARGNGRRRHTSANPMHSKIRYLWRDLHQAGAVTFATDAALDSYVRRMTGASSLRFVTREQAWTLINAMKKWLSRWEPGGPEKGS